ncbi:hypothetical protein ACQHIV_22970 [Kribbella sp. GL6]|uniref:hypothetical protein n=1 Tax=Kribbella sp. GL6 TaxID=3419765 RepID=UPI003D00DC32
MREDGMPVITADGVFRFALGTFLTFASLTTALWIARTHLHHRPTWPVAVGTGLGAALLCLGLLWNRSWFGPFFVDLLIAAGLIVAGVFALKEVGESAKQTPGSHLFLWILLGADFVGFLLVYSLGNYPDD